MKIKVIHHVCGREILVQQILESAGHCPWDGKAFTGDYTASLASALELAESAGTALEIALDHIAGMDPSFTFVRESVLASIEEPLDRLGRAQRAVRT